MSVLMKEEQRGWDARNLAVAMTSKEEDMLRRSEQANEDSKTLSCRSEESNE